MTRLTLVVLALIAGSYCFTFNRMDNSDMESDFLVRTARSTSTSSEEDKKEQAEKELKKVTPKFDSAEVEGSGARPTRQIQAEPVQEGSGSLFNENNEPQHRIIRDSDVEGSGQERVLNDLPIEEASGEELRTLHDAPDVEGSGLKNSRFFARLADSPLEEGSGDEGVERTIRSEGSGEAIESTDRTERDVDGSGLETAESVDAPTEGSGDILPTRVSRDVEGSGLDTAESIDGSGEVLTSQHVRMIREEGSGLSE